jgi:hypothetical protein
MSLYTIAATYGVKLKPNARWGSVDVSTASVASLLQNYRKIYLTLTNQFVSNSIFVDMDAFRTNFSAYQGTVQALLDSYGNGALPTVASVPVASPKHALYADLFHSGYNLELVAAKGSTTTSGTTTWKNRLAISRTDPATDMRGFYQNCLVSINGFYYATETDGTYTYVNGAGDSLLKSRQNNAGLLSFENLGGISVVPITSSMIFGQGSGTLLKQRAYINSGIDTTGKTVLLVLGGYLCFPDENTFSQINNGVFSINFNNIRVLERFYESYDYIDYSGLGLRKTSDNKRQVSLEDFFSDAVLTKYMTMTQSFFVVVNKSELFFNKYRVINPQLRNKYFNDFEPKYPLVVGEGRTLEYRKIKEVGRWALNVQDNYYHNRVFSSLNKKALTTVSDQRDPQSPVSFSHASLLEIGSDF